MLRSPTARSAVGTTVSGRPAGALETVFFATYQGCCRASSLALLFFVAGYFTPASYDSKDQAVS